MRTPLLAAVLTLSATAVLADTLELGIGAAGLSLPDYRGSDEQRSYLLPVPYISYSSKHLDVSRGGVRSKLALSERAELDLSLAATPPVRTGDNQAREGMAELEPILEVGPSLRYRLSDKDAAMRTEIVLPVRAAVGFDDWHAHYRGLSFSPRLGWDWQANRDEQAWKLGGSLGLLWGNQRLHQYVYGVSAADARPERPAYQAKAGYAGTQLTLSASRSFGDYWLGTFVRSDQLAGASFADSPLLKRKHNLSAGLTLVWRFYRRES